MLSILISWPNPVGNIGFMIYTHLINELYLPGLSLFNEIRDIYFLSYIDPNKFILKQDDFLNYFSFGFESFSAKQISAFDNEYKGLIKESAYAQTTANNDNDNDHYRHQEVSKASLNDFNSMTIIHLLIFSGQMFHSYQSKIKPDLIRKINNYFIRAIPEYKHNNKIELQLITKNAKDKTIKEDLMPIVSKNIPQNVNNKNLLNSFCNIIDQGIHLNYHDQFAPLVNKMLQKLNIEAMNDNESTNKLLSLSKYLIPRIYQIECKKDSLNVINCYTKTYLQLQKKYLEHLSIINIKEFKISNEQLKTIEKYNLMSETKLEMVRTKIQLKYIVTEGHFHLFLMSVFNNLNEYFNAKKPKDYDNNKTPLNSIDIQIPTLKYFLDNIIIYLFPHANTNTILNNAKINRNSIAPNPQTNCLFNYLKQRDIIYHLIHLNKETIKTTSTTTANKEEAADISKSKSRLINTYLTEAKCCFDLCVYRVKGSNNEKLFYSKLIIENMMNTIDIELLYDDDTIDKVTIAKGGNGNSITTLKDKQYVKIVRIDKDNLYGHNNDNDDYMLDVFVYEEKWDIYDKGNIIKEKEKTYFQSICDSYRANRIKIKNKASGGINIDVDNLGMASFEGDIDIHPVYFESIDKERFKVKIATFIDINQY